METLLGMMRDMGKDPQAYQEGFKKRLDGSDTTPATSDEGKDDDAKILRPSFGKKKDT